MAKRTVSFADYQEPTWEEYTGEDPPAGKWFTGNVTKAKYDTEKDQMIFIVEITDEDSPFKGWGRGYYAPFEGERKFAFQEMLKALQGGKTSDVTLDWENEKAVAAWLAKQRPVKFQTRMYDDRVVLGKVRALMEAVSTAPKKGAAEPELDVEDDTIEDYTEEELGEKDLDELKAILDEEFQVAVPRKKRGQSGDDYTDVLIDAILDAQEAANAEEGDDNQDAVEAANAGEDEEEDDFDDGFEEEEIEEAEPEPAPRARRSRAAAPAAKAVPAKKAATGSTRRRRS